MIPKTFQGNHSSKSLLLKGIWLQKENRLLQIYFVNENRTDTQTNTACLKSTEATNNVTVIETQFMWLLQLRNLTKAYAQRPKHLGPRLDSHLWREIEKEREKEFVTGEKERSRPAMVVEHRGGWQPPHATTYSRSEWRPSLPLLWHDIAERIVFTSIFMHKGFSKPKTPFLLYFWEQISIPVANLSLYSVEND